MAEYFFNYFLKTVTENLGFRRNVFVNEKHTSSRRFYCLVTNALSNDKLFPDQLPAVQQLEQWLFHEETKMLGRKQVFQEVLSIIC